MKASRENGLQSTHWYQGHVMAVILAGGQGTRLYPLTQSRCKPAVVFGGCYRLIDVPISNALNSEIRNIAVISQYFAAELHHHILSTYRLDTFQPGQFHLLSPEETRHTRKWFQGTADAVRQNLDYLMGSSAEYFLILSGDQLYNMDFRPLVDFARNKEADLVVATLPVEEAEAKRMGLLVVEDDRKIQDFCEKPSDPALLAKFRLSKTDGCSVARQAPQYLGSMGIYVFARSALASILREKGDDFGREMIPLQVGRGGAFAFIYDGYWEDIGTVSSYYHANLALVHQKNCLDIYDEHHPIYTRTHQLPSALIQTSQLVRSIVSPGARIDAAEVVDSIIGLRSCIKRGAIIRNSVILGNQGYFPHRDREYISPGECCIGENSWLEKTIVDEHVRIGKNVQLLNKNQCQYWDGDGFYIRDGIIIVPSGSCLPDGFTV